MSERPHSSRASDDDRSLDREIAALSESVETANELLTRLNRQIHEQDVAAAGHLARLTALEATLGRLEKVVRDGDGIQTQLAVLRTELAEHKRLCSERDKQGTSSLRFNITTILSLAAIAASLAALLSGK